jgi:hypothetical protein
MAGQPGGGHTLGKVRLNSRHPGRNLCRGLRENVPPAEIIPLRHLPGRSWQLLRDGSQIRPPPERAEDQSLHRPRRLPRLRGRVPRPSVPRSGTSEERYRSAFNPQPILRASAWECFLTRRSAHLNVRVWSAPLLDIQTILFEADDLRQARQSCWPIQNRTCAHSPESFEWFPVSRAN